MIYTESSLIFICAPRINQLEKENLDAKQLKQDIELLKKVGYFLFWIVATGTGILMTTICTMDPKGKIYNYIYDMKRSLLPWHFQPGPFQKCVLSFFLLDINQARQPNAFAFSFQWAKMQKLRYTLSYGQECLYRKWHHNINTTLEHTHNIAVCLYIATQQTLTIVCFYI